MRLTGLRVGHKIVIPFTILFVVTTGVIAFLAISLLSRTLERRVASHVEQVSEMISRTGFALNPSILQELKRVVDAEIVTYSTAGDVLVATLDREANAELLDRVRDPEVSRRIFGLGEPLVMRDLMHAGQPYKVAWRPVRNPPDTLVALIVPTSDLAAAQQAATRTIGFVALVTVLAMALLSQLIARSITQPVQRLVDFTRRLAAGDLGYSAPVAGRDEIGRLTEAFNDMARRLRASEQELLHAEKLSVAGQLAARVAHDIRNPASSIKMHAQLLRSRLDSDGAGRDSLEAILREIDRVEWVVGGLLDLARPEALELVPADVNEVVKDALRATEPTLTHRKIRCERQLDGAIPKVRLDPTRLGDALRNLISNAADAMPDGGDLRATTRLAQSRSHVEIEIRDDGTGLEGASPERLFDPFYTTKREGVGLGLLNTRSIVERHEGTVALISRPEGGTRAVLTLPVADERENAKPGEREG